MAKKKSVKKASKKKASKKKASKKKVSKKKAGRKKKVSKQAEAAIDDTAAPESVVDVQQTVKKTKSPRKSTSKKTTKKKSSKSPARTAELTHDMIAARAFEVWVRKGRPLGQDDANWREAEAELKEELGLV